MSSFCRGFQLKGMGNHFATDKLQRTPPNSSPVGVGQQFGASAGRNDDDDSTIFRGSNYFIQLWASPNALV